MTSHHLGYDWPVHPWYQRLFMGKARPDGNNLSFIVGSCLYPGTTFDKERSDSIFEAIGKHIPDRTSEHLPGVDHIMVLGDVIYADATANIFDPKVAYEKYKARYRQALTGESTHYAKTVFRKVPAYFAVDDHEFKDNWEGKSDELDIKDFDSAKKEAWRYLGLPVNGWLKEVLWYHFSSAKFPFFVFDTRFEREVIDRRRFDALITKDQLDAFGQWVENMRGSENKVIFLASGSHLGPIEKDMVANPWLFLNHDGLLGYPGFIKEIVELLQKQGGEKQIVWLTGDPHFSSVNEIDLLCNGSKETERIKIWNICASGLYSPAPFANSKKNKFEFDALQTFNLDNIKIEITQHLLTDNQQHFVRVDLSKNVLYIQAYDRDDESLGETIYIDLTIGKLGKQPK